MATISIDLAGISTSFTLEDNDAARILTAHIAMYTAPDMEGVPVTPTSEEAVNRLAQEVVDGLASTAVSWEQAEASRTAVVAVPAIAATIVPVV